MSHAFYVAKCYTEISNVRVHHSPLVRFLSKSFPKFWNTFSLGNRVLKCQVTCVFLDSFLHHTNRSAPTCPYMFIPLTPASSGKGMNPTASQRGGKSLHDIIRGILHLLKSGACNQGRESIFLIKWMWPWGGGWVTSTGIQHWPHSGALCMNWPLSFDHSNDVLSRRFGEQNCSYSITKAVFNHNTKAGFILLHQI